MNLREGTARPVLLLAATVALVAAVAAWRWHWFLDLQVYRMGADALPHGDLYAVRYRVADLPFTYPPFAALTLIPAALLPWPVAAGLWAGVGVLALATVLGVVRATCPAPADARSAALLQGAPLVALVAGALVLQPVWSTFSFGQVNLVLMALVVLDVLGPQRRWSGVLLGIAAGIKLTPLFLVAFLVVIGRRRPAVVAAATALATALGTALVVPHQSWTYWSSALLDTGRIGATEYAGNQSIAGLLARLLGHEAPTAVWVAVAAPVGLAALLVARRRWIAADREGASGDRVLALGAASIGMVLCSPISWDHHWVWLVPIALALALDPSALRRRAAGVLVVVLLSRAMWWAPFRDGREFAWTPLEQVSGNVYVWTGLALLALLAVRTGGGAAGALEEHGSEVRGLVQ